MNKTIIFYVFLCSFSIVLARSCKSEKELVRSIKKENKRLRFDQIGKLEIRGQSMSEILNQLERRYPRKWHNKYTYESWQDEYFYPVQQKKSYAV